MVCLNTNLFNTPINFILSRMIFEHLFGLKESKAFKCFSFYQPCCSKENKRNTFTDVDDIFIPIHFKSKFNCSGIFFKINKYFFTYSANVCNNTSTPNCLDLVQPTNTKNLELSYFVFYICSGKSIKYTSKSTAKFRLL